MQVDFVIVLSAIVIVAIIIGMGYAIRFTAKHIAQDADKAKKGEI